MKKYSAASIDGIVWGRLAEMSDLTVGQIIELVLLEKHIFSPSCEYTVKGDGADIFHFSKIWNNSIGSYSIVFDICAARTARTKRSFSYNYAAWPAGTTVTVLDWVKDWKYISSNGGIDSQILPPGYEKHLLAVKFPDDKVGCRIVFKTDLELEQNE